jgi:hypothetical protein
MGLPTRNSEERLKTMSSSAHTLSIIEQRTEIIRSFTAVRDRPARRI